MSWARQRRPRVLLGRGHDGKLVLQCRGSANCSFSSILKKLNIKLRHLNRDTNESVIRRLRTMEVQLGLYQHHVPLVADPVVFEYPHGGNGTGCLRTMSEHADMIDVAPPALAPQHVSGPILYEDHQPDPDQKPGPEARRNGGRSGWQARERSRGVVARASSPCRRKPRARCLCHSGSCRGKPRARWPCHLRN